MFIKCMIIVLAWFVVNTAFARSYTEDELFVIQHKPEMQQEIDQVMALEKSLSGSKRAKLEKIYRKSYRILRNKLETEQRT